MSSQFDVVVVGCGIAGLSAAVSAAEAGAKVAVLERAAVEERGGNTRWTEAFMRMKSETEVADDFGRSLIREQVEMGVAVRMAVLEVLTRNLPAPDPRNL